MTRTVLITGSSRDLGTVIVKTLATQGFEVITNYNQDREATEALAKELGGKTIAIQADVTQRSEVDHLVNRTTHHSEKIDVVVNNALVNFEFDPNAQEAFKDLAWEDYRQQVDGTLRGAFNVTQNVIPQSIERGSGAIVSIGTDLYQHPVVPYHEYTTARAGLIGFTRDVAAELRQYGITANIVSGGLLETANTSAVTTPDVFDSITQTTPLRKVTTLQDVANMVAYLSNEAASGMTGQNVTVNGGLTMN